MADAAVEFLLQNLKELLLYNVELISGVKDQVELLHSDLSLFKSFLTEYTAKRIKNEVLQEFVNQIRDVVYEAEDTLDTFVTHAAVQKARSFLKKTFHVTDHGSELRRVAKQIETIRSKVKNIYDKKEFGFEALQTHLEGSTRNPREKMEPIVEEDNVVGFQDEAQNVINLLTGGSEELEVISVVGMPGLGKTTLAKMIFRHTAIEHEFYNRAWVYVSYEYNRKEVFLNILRQFTRPNDDMYKMNEKELAHELRTFLEQGKYFIVLDDVWTKEAWDCIKIAFPNRKNGSRILLTSRESVVAWHANPDNDPYELGFLKDEESWELLQRKALGSKECPEDLESYGWHIVKECKGLPLAIVVIGGILLEKGNESYWWQKVSESVDTYVNADRGKTMENFIEMSFNHLPYHLKACFLYFGVFPEDYQISVWKLACLWIAEGFIVQENDAISLEDRAEEYLDDLVSRNLVMVGERGSNGKIKTCHVHDMLHVFCRNQGAKEIFFHEIKQFDPNSFSSSHPNLTNYRRLCIHSRILSYISSKPAGPRIRSFLSFTSDETDMPKEKNLYVPGAFKLIRVFDAKPIRFLVFPRNLSQLIHLRYLVLSIHFKILPQEISQLWNLQTLIIETSSRTLEINEDIWKVRRLRHLKTNTETSTTVLSKRSKGEDETSPNGNLLTLSTISPESCTQSVLSRAPNLKKLGIRGPLSNLLCSFDTVGKLDDLENLKLLNDVHPKPQTEGKIIRFPQKYQFPQKIKKLTLENTRLDWTHMSTLGILDSLEILKLKDNAFEGHEWNAILDGGFLRLKVLKIGKTDLVSWRASAHHFPRLKSLYVRECTKLFEIPFGLADVLSLHIIDLYYTTSSAVASARRIQQHKIKMQDQKTSKGRGFKLTISPPDQDQ